MRWPPPQFCLPVSKSEPASPYRRVDPEDKVSEYLAAGTQLVWLEFPESRTVIAFGQQGGAVFRPGDTIAAEPVLPGFAAPVTDLFPPPAAR